MPRITRGAILVFAAIGSTIVAALLGSPDWLIIVILTVLCTVALVLPTAIREFGSDQLGRENREVPPPTSTHRGRRAHSSDSSSSWFGFDGGWSGDGGSDSSGGSSGGGD